MRTLKTSLFVITALLTLTTSFAEDKISAYVEVGTVKGTLQAVTAKVKEGLASKNFKVIGEYSPLKDEKSFVVVYTRDDLQKIALNVKNRGVLASVLKIGLLDKGGKVKVSMNNPDYLFHAYLRKEAVKRAEALSAITADAQVALMGVGQSFMPFGGEMTASELHKYYYMWPAATQTFDDPVEFKEFSSFEEGVKTITENLNKQKGQTYEVYSVVLKEQKVAVFGIGMAGKETGEQNYLPKVGVEHLSAMPYELVLMDKKPSMLHGRFRIAVHWPELTMGTFMGIVSTPGDIETAFEGLTKK